MKHLETSATAVALAIAVITGTVAIENRFAKSAVVQRDLSNLWIKTVRLRVLELQLKPAPLSTADQALLEYLQQELKHADD